MRIVLLLDEGAGYNDIKEKLDTTAPPISLWKRRYREEGLVGLATFHPGQPPQKLTRRLRAKILAKTQQAPPDGSTHWSLRKMASVMGVGKDLIRQVWREADLKRTGWSATWPATTHILKRKPPRSSDCI